MISGLLITNFRQLSDLKVEGLRRFNLIVGQNNVGKSSLLEALWLLVNEGRLEVLLDVLSQRGDFVKPGLFREHPKDFARSPFSTLTKWPPKQEAESLSCLIMASIGEIRLASLIISFDFSTYYTGDIKRNYNFCHIDGTLIDDNERINADALTSPRLFQAKRGDNVFVVASGLDERTTQDFWERIALTEREDDVVEALKLLEPDVQRVTMTTFGPLIKLIGAPGPVPLKRMGDGMTRLFGLILAMVNAKNGILLIDEVEVGLHRATLDIMWPFLFTLAHRFNVQLFATTHSWDCITSFADAAKATPEDDGALIRLERKGSDIVAVSYDETTLATATEQGIEVR